MREHLLELFGFWTYWARMVQYCIGTSINTRPHLPGTCRGDTAVCAHLVRASLFNSSSKLSQDNNLNMCLNVSVSLCRHSATLVDIRALTGSMSSLEGILSVLDFARSRRWQCSLIYIHQRPESYLWQHRLCLGEKR